MIRFLRLRGRRLEGVDVLTFVIGFAIGAGILGLPVKFGVSGAGFIPSATMLVVALIFQVITALYIVEGIKVCGSREFPAIVSRCLGKAAAGVSYVFIALYLVGAMTAYVVFGGVALHTLTRSALPVWAGMIAYWVAGVAITVGGSRAIARAEEAMVAGIMILLLINILLCLTTPYVRLSNLTWGNWGDVLSVFGVVLFAYAIHAAIPTAYRSFGGGGRYPRLLTLGLSISAAIYIAWSAAYMSILTPSDYTRTFVGALTHEVHHGIAGMPAPVAVAELGKLREAAYVGYAFGFLTTLTSFIAAAHALTQISCDVAGRNGSRSVKAFLAASTAPALALALLRLGSFTQWLNFAGAVGAAVFTGIIPSVMAIRLRVRRPEGFRPLVPGGIPVAVVTLGFYVAGMAWYLMHASI